MVIFITSVTLDCYILFLLEVQRCLTTYRLTQKPTVNTELQFCTKVATRWQSLLSRLLCKFNEINRLYTSKSHNCNGWVIQESTQARTAINKPPKQSSPFNNKPSFWIRKTQQARFSENAKCSISLPFPHFAPAKFTTNQHQNSLRQTKKLACFTVWVDHEFEGENAYLPTT